MESVNIPHLEGEDISAIEAQVEISREALEGLGLRLQLAREKVDDFKKKHADIAGNSRFRDITRNTLAACFSAWKYFRTERGQADYECIIDRLPKLEKYLTLLEEHPDFFKQERKNEKRAFPDVVDAADEIAGRVKNFKIIPYYIEEARKRLEPQTDTVQ